ncbi:MAG TPA: endonuclease MutS2 [Longimicrobiales bacterium]|nr:endonuclease MutS2 [Longimicrobiales bacterium]
MNGHALDVLQYPEALAVVAGHASSALGARAVRALEPSDSYAFVVDELLRVDQMSAFLFRAQDWHMPPIPDARAALRRLGVEGSVLDAAELRDTAILLRGSAATRRAILQHAEDYPLLAAVAERLVKLDDDERRIREAIDDGGEVRDNASHELARLRREVRGARSRIVERLEHYIATLPPRFQVQDASVSLRDGRYVIPVRREGRGEVGGLVHDESATGATLFVEPPVALELMNRLRELELAEAREVLRILRELTESLRPSHAMITDALDALIRIDSLFARARYALHVQGSRPEVSADTSALTLVNARHPLLLATTSGVVPFDLAMEPAEPTLSARSDDGAAQGAAQGERTLLVSGPNTGGKTVLLKAIGLISTLAQAGVIPPVGPGTRLPLFRDIFADIGDEQSIEASLSTFSAHLKNLREIVEHADDRSLALIDEMGSGTDPAEGGALADAILRSLTRRGTLTIATTHLGQLKQIAAEEPGVVNASLQFDAAELRPTYRLLKGVPGRSYGLAIARRLGLPADLLEAAESALPESERDAGQLLAELEEKDRALATAVSEAAREARRATSLREELEKREESLRRREKEAERRARQQARDLLLNAREEVETVIRELRDAALSGAGAIEDAAREARRRVEQRARREAERTPREQVERGAGDDVREGSFVRITASGLQGVVVELRDDRATVEVGGLRVQVPAAELTVAEAPKPVRERQQARGGWTAPDLDASSEVDLRGLRAEEVASRLNPALDAAVQAALPSLRVIHGKGTGALREVVTEIMRGDRRVKSFRPGGLGEGGTGVTVAELQ